MDTVITVQRTRGINAVLPNRPLVDEKLFSCWGFRRWWEGGIGSLEVMLVIHKFIITHWNKLFFSLPIMCDRKQKTLRGNLERISLSKTKRKATEGNASRTDLQNTSSGVTNEKYQCTRNGNLIHWYGNQCLLFQHNSCSGQSRNLWEGEKAPISWHHWDLVENRIEDKIGVQSPEQTSITTT